MDPRSRPAKLVRCTDRANELLGVTGKSLGLARGLSLQSQQQTSGHRRTLGLALDFIPGGDKATSLEVPEVESSPSRRIWK